MSHPGSMSFVLYTYTCGAMCGANVNSETWRTWRCMPQVSRLPRYLYWWWRNHWRHGLGLPILVTLPHSPMSTVPLRHCLHPEHLTKMLMLGNCQCLGQNVSRHIISPYKLEVNATIDDTLPDKMIPDINMLCRGVIDGVPGKQVGSAIIDVQSIGATHTFMELAKDPPKPFQLLGV